MNSRLPVLMLLALLFQILGGCASSTPSPAASASSSASTVSSWKLPRTTRHPRFHHLYVVAVVPPGELAAELEAAVVNRLRERGLQATGGTGDFSEAERVDLTACACLAARMQAHGADGALVVSYVDVVDRRFHIPPTTAQVAVAVPPDPGSAGMVIQHHELMLEPGYEVSSHASYLQSSLFAAEGDQPVWQAESVTYDATGLRDSLDSLSRSLAAELRRSGAPAR